MKIVFYEPLTLVDYPGALAATVFTPGCVFRCPYCHSPELADPSHVDFAAAAPDKTEEFFAFLATRVGKLDGVCITGGEPTLHPGLIAFMQRIKDMGFRVKLDTNGNFPERVAEILDADVVDYWAMDIKHAPKKYAQAAGVKVDIAAIRESVALIMAHARDYEFRTTTVPGIHTEKDFDAIGQWIAGAQRYFIQPFRDIKVLDRRSATAAAAAAPLDYAACAARVRQHVDSVIVR